MEGSVRLNFPEIYPPTTATRAEAEALINSEIEIIDQMLVLVGMRDSIDHMLGVIRAEDPQDGTDSSLRIAIYSAVYPVLSRGRIASRDEIRGIAERIMAGLADHPALQDSDKRQQTLDSLVHALSRDEIWTILSRRPARNEDIQAVLVGWANNTAEIAAYGRENYDELVAGIEELGRMKNQMRPNIRAIYDNAPQGQRIGTTLGDIRNRAIPEMERALAQGLRPQTRNLIQASERIRCNLQGASCQRNSEARLTYGGLVHVREGLRRVLQDRYQIPGAAADSLYSSNTRLLYGNGEEQHWAIRADRRLQELGIETFTVAGIGGQYDSLDLATTHEVGERGSSVLSTFSGGLLWQSPGDYSVGLGVQGDLDYSGVFGVNGYPNILDYGVRALIYGSGSPRAPYFGLNFGLRGTSSDVPYQPNPDGMHFQLRSVLGWQFTNAFGVIGGLDYAVGEYNTEAWYNLAGRFGLMFNMGRAGSVMAGYQGGFELREPTLLSGETADVLAQYDYHGAVLAYVMQSGLHTLELTFSIAHYPDVLRMRTSLSARYRFERINNSRFGLDILAMYSRGDLVTGNGTSDTVRLAPGLTIALAGGRNGGHGVDLALRLFVEWNQYDFADTNPELGDNSGVRTGGMLEGRWGRGRRDSEIRNNELDRNALGHSGVMRIAQLSLEPADSLFEGQMYVNPGVIAATNATPGGNINGINRALLAWRTAGALDAQYNIVETVLDAEIERRGGLRQAIEYSDGLNGRAGRFGFDPGSPGNQQALASQTVSIGDVAPLPFRIGAYVPSRGSGDPTDMRSSDRANELRQYRRGHRTISHYEQVVLDAYTARRQMIARGIEVDGPRAAQWSALYALTSVERIIKGEDAADDTLDLETSLAEFLRSGDIGDINTIFQAICQSEGLRGYGTFADALRNELTEARGIGPAVLAVALWRIAQVEGLTEAELETIMQRITSLDAEGLAILQVLSLGERVLEDHRPDAADVTAWLGRVGNTVTVNPASPQQNPPDPANP